jgi:hypothetical protein
MQWMAARRWQIDPLHGSGSRKWWLEPSIVVMVAAGARLVFAQGSALAPFICTIL